MADGDLPNIIEGLDFNSRKTVESHISARVNELIDDGLSRKNNSQPRRTYLGASAIGHDCERQMLFELAGALRERSFKPETLRKFDLGHTLEEMARGWFIDAGFKLSQKDRNGRLFVYEQLDGRFKGHVDGVLLDGPEVPGLAYPALWEHKGVGNQTYSKVKREGLAKASPGYYAQVQIYMGYLGLEQTVFTVTAAEDGEQQHLLIPFDLDKAQYYSDRAVRVVKALTAGELLPKAYRDPSHWICATRCDFRERCSRYG